MVNNITLEELIAIKLELSCRTLGSPLFGLPIWKHLNKLTEEAVLLFAISTTKTPQEAASFLGMTPYKLHKICKKYKLFSYLNPAYDKLVEAKAERLKNERLLNDTTSQETTK